MCSKKSIWNCIVVLSLILSCILVAASIASLVTYNCALDFAVTKFQADNVFYTYLFYFYNPECNATDYFLMNHVPAQRTYGWSIGYLTLNVIWALTTLLLSQGQFYWGTTTCLWLTYPWVFTAFGVLCADVASTIMYMLDYEHLIDYNSMKDYLGLTTSGVVDHSDYFPMPTLIMVGIFAKGVLGWILVLVSFIAICIMLRKVGKTDDQLLLQTRPAPFDYYMPSGAANQAFENEMSEIDLRYQASPTSQKTNNGINNGSWNGSRQIIPRIPTSIRASNSAGAARWEDQRYSQDTDLAWESYEEENLNNYPHSSRYVEDTPYAQRPWSYLPQTLQSREYHQDNFKPHQRTMYY